MSARRPSPRSLAISLAVALALATALAPAATGALGASAPSALPGDAPAAHPTPPGATPTPTVDERTPTGDGTGMRMRMADDGSVVNPNRDRVPPGCDAIRGTKRVTVRAGTAYAAEDEAFAFDPDRIQAPPCTRLVVTFVNEDAVRHQFMVHGLPTEVHQMGMFTIEVDGPGSVTGVFVTPATEYVLHTHCSLPQHTQKGMQMQVVVGDGSAGLVGGPGHEHGGPGHTHTAGGHSPSSGIGAPGFGPAVAVAAVIVAALVARRRGR